jgi:hypothetical protein
LKIVSERIGHANVGCFLQTDAHVLGNEDREAADRTTSALLANAGISRPRPTSKMMSKAKFPETFQNATNPPDGSPVDLR